MALIQCEELVPEVYVNESRDFQLLCRVFNTLLNSSKWYTDGIIHSIDTNIISNRLLELLKTYVGFFSNQTIDNDSLRMILKAFPYLIKYKGSRKGIEEAIYLFLKTQDIKTQSYILITNKEIVPPSTLEDVYSIEIGIKSFEKIDITILRELIRYVVPTGYLLKFVLYNDQQAFSNFVIKNQANIVVISKNYNSMVASSYDGESPISLQNVPNNGINTQSVDTVDIINSANDTEDTYETEEYKDY